MTHLYHPITKAKEISKYILDGDRRKYYRISRAGLWYGGIATADCCGCNLKCIFCWSNFPRDNPEKCGKFYTPEEVFSSLVSCAKRHGYQRLRISGNEVTLAKEHLLRLLKLVDKTDYQFIIETNGTLLDKEYVKELHYFKNIHVRISFKGTNREEFSMLTGAEPLGFDLQLNALENCISYGIKCWPAVVISFSTVENYHKFRKTIAEIDKKLMNEIEEEVIFLLPHIEKRLQEAKIKPLIYENIGFAKCKEI
jgi:uncharacterized Fe-S cluster-containing radical SAM superfamily protein